MPFRSLVISSLVRISTKNNQLIIQTDYSRSVPIEDIQAVLLEAKNECDINIFEQRKMPMHKNAWAFC